MLTYIQTCKHIRVHVFVCMYPLICLKRCKVGIIVLNQSSLHVKTSTISILECPVKSNFTSCNVINPHHPSIPHMLKISKMASLSASPLPSSSTAKSKMNTPQYISLSFSFGQVLFFFFYTFFFFSSRIILAGKGSPY